MSVQDTLVSQLKMCSYFYGAAPVPSPQDGDGGDDNRGGNFGGGGGGPNSK